MESGSAQYHTAQSQVPSSIILCGVSLKKGDFLKIYCKALSIRSSNPARRFYLLQFHELFTFLIALLAIFRVHWYTGHKAIFQANGYKEHKAIFFKQTRSVLNITVDKQPCCVPPYISSWMIAFCLVYRKKLVLLIGIQKCMYRAGKAEQVLQCRLGTSPTTSRLVGLRAITSNNLPATHK